MLDQGQIDQFKEEGFLLVRQLLAKADLQPLIDELEEQVGCLARDAVERGLLNAAATFPQAPFATRLARIAAACTEPEWPWKQYFSEQKPLTPGIFRLRTAPALLDAAGSLIGPEILAHPQFARRVHMPANAPTVIPWHQDLAYLVPEEAGDTLVVNFWVPLVATTAANGCLQVVRGSHRQGLVDHRLHQPGAKGSRGIVEADLPAGDIVTAEMEAGDVLLTMERLVHRSLPNRSDTVRWSVDTRYCQIGLPTGRAKVPGFVARSRRHPERVAGCLDDWLAVLDGR
ncbi:MAG: hypothetical protein GKR89_19980 [Candidatus Latescibacteria bacterium]|nr:hypothetical protein [Candidatus Latescibacterota bacterium]